jgi:hypothetical protein
LPQKSSGRLRPDGDFFEHHLGAPFGRARKLAIVFGLAGCCFIVDRKAQAEKIMRRFSALRFRKIGAEQFIGTRCARECVRTDE